MGFKNASIVASVFLLLLPPSLWAEAEPKSKSEDISVEWRAERLDVSANNAPLTDVMLSIAGKTGLEIHGIEYLKGSIQANVKQKPLPIALKELLQRANYLLQERSAFKNAHPVLTVLSFNASNINQETDKSAQADSNKAIKVPASAGYVPEQYRKLYVYAEKGNIRALKQVIETGENAAQEIATKLLAQKDPALASELAAETAKSTDPNRRLSAIQSLSELDNALAAKALGTALNDPDLGVRNAAVMGLHNQTSSNAISYLAQALQDENASIRILALDLLAEKGTNGVAGINEAMASNDPQLREHAQELLQQIIPGE